MLFLSFQGLSTLRQRLASADRETRDLAQRRGEGEKLRGPNLRAKCLVIQAQCPGGGGGRGKVSGLRMPSWSGVSELQGEEGWSCFQGRVRT